MGWNEFEFEDEVPQFNKEEKREEEKEEVVVVLRERADSAHRIATAVVSNLPAGKAVPYGVVRGLETMLKGLLDGANG